MVTGLNVFSITLEKMFKLTDKELHQVLSVMAKP